MKLFFCEGLGFSQKQPIFLIFFLDINLASWLIFITN
jgi:hypothetical protein